MKTYRFELKDHSFQVLLDGICSTQGKPYGFTVELNRQWKPGSKEMTIKVDERISVRLTPEDIKENPRFQPTDWNPTRSWGIPEDEELIFSIRKSETEKEIARLAGYFDGLRFERPDGQSMHVFCRGLFPPRYKVLIKLREEEDEKLSGEFLEIVYDWERKLEEVMNA